MAKRSKSERRRILAQQAARHPELYALVQAWIRGELGDGEFDRRYTEAEATIMKLEGHNQKQIE